MFFLRLETHPKPSHADYGAVDGAWAACWVASEDPEEAEKAARAFLEDLGWDIETLAESYPVTRGQYPSQSESLERFDQAVIDGIVVTLHTWPVGAPDE